MKRERNEEEVEIVSWEYFQAIDAAVAMAEKEYKRKKERPRAHESKSSGILLGISGLRFIPRFITRDEERILMRSIDASPWNTSLKRRTQHYGYTYSYTAKSTATLAPPIPEWCSFLVDRLLEQHVLLVRPDQLIVNEYEPGQGIYPHVDSTSSFEDGIVSVSLGSDVVMDFIHQRSKDKKEVTLPRCSVLAMHGDARYEWRHGIAFRKTDHGVKRHRRISLTFRKMK